MVFKHLLVPPDFSENAAHALRKAVQMARHGEAHLTLLHVGLLPHATTFDFPAYGVPLPEAMLEAHRQMTAERKHVLERIAKEEIPEDVQWTPRLREGYPPEEILAELGAAPYDLLVMGTHGDTGIKHVLLGSVTERVLRTSPIPVLVVH
mgnify:CR=1 FL=1